MKILLINSVCGIGSTGKICVAIARDYAAQGHQVKIAYGREGTVPEDCREFAVRIGSDLDVRISAVRTRLLDDHGFANEGTTRKFLRWAEEFNPDLLWLHNLHGYYLNVEQLFAWIKGRPQMQVKWTLHDCWAFTGHCAHFVGANCEAWKQGCTRCPEKRAYPASILRDNCRNNYLRKKSAFTGVANMTLITPSRWLAELVGESFLRQYPVEVRYNTIDREIFKPTPGDFRQNHGLENKKILLGVASVWTDRKGFSDFLKLRELLDDSWAIVMVGLNPNQLESLPGGILGLPKTHNGRELAEIYTAADVLFNPTYEDTYPTVNLEAESCGTRVITYDTGGSAETLNRQDSIAIPVGHYSRVAEELR